MTRVLATFLLLGTLACAKATSKSASAPAPAPAPAGPPATLSGVVSLDVPVNGANIFVFKANPGGEATELTPTTVTDSTGKFSLSVPAGAIALNVDTAVLMSKTKDADGQDSVLWSFVVKPGQTSASNMNELTSLAYEVAVQEKDFEHITEAAARVAKVFGTDANLAALDPASAVLTKLGQLVQATVVQDKVTVGEINTAITKDLRDGTLDGIGDGAPVTLGPDGTYAKVLSGLKLITGTK